MDGCHLICARSLVFFTSFGGSDSAASDKWVLIEATVTDLRGRLILVGRYPLVMDDLRGWLGLLCLVLAGAGWGAQVARHGVTWPGLALTLTVSVLGLALVTGAFLRGHDLPLILGAVGAVAASAAMVFARQDGT